MFLILALLLLAVERHVRVRRALGLPRSEDAATSARCAAECP